MFYPSLSLTFSNKKRFLEYIAALDRRLFRAQQRIKHLKLGATNVCANILLQIIIICDNSMILLLLRNVSVGVFLSQTLFD